MLRKALGCIAVCSGMATMTVAASRVLGHFHSCEDVFRFLIAGFLKEIDCPASHTSVLFLMC